MTREEAIKRLEQRLWNMKYVNETYVDSVNGEALEMAVKALKKQSKRADVVEVVRCKDCKWYKIYELTKDGAEDHRYKPSLCTLFNRKRKPDWFCADGERYDSSAPAVREEKG